MKFLLAIITSVRYCWEQFFHLGIVPYMWDEMIGSQYLLHCWENTTFPSRLLKTRGALSCWNRAFAVPATMSRRVVVWAFTETYRNPHSFAFCIVSAQGQRVWLSRFQIPETVKARVVIPLHLEGRVEPF